MTPALLILALASAAMMGLAIQRGATCMVAAVDAAIIERSYGRALALGEAALWVGGLLAVTQLAGVLTMPPALYRATALTVAGGVLLGFGAWINRACVFGAVARIGSGQWAWLATPVGFFLGCLIPIAKPEATGHPAPFANAALIAVPFGALAVWRLVEVVRAPGALAHLWHPHRATLLIAVTFVTTMLSVGLWAYTDALAAIAKAMDVRIGLRGAMVVALLAGSILGGWFAGKIRWVPPTLDDVVRCLVGGALMGAGGLLVPGTNDGLIMVGLPLLQPHAWIAVTTMTLTIAALILLARHVRRPAVA
ncbi:MAG: YeeE/YedE family protein [Sphingomonas sp.]|uniref:YeeE/YedE thiosulfate transporter family protein n=1 Tax=Sphingomonas sp. TaxID=28214 RepID=UPI001AD1FC0E|nr:YeeE/YedE thiosulfate transporter family protein [Sphingomonas sp.]MBN8814373.1 YeeE/YedE family protein [Sphingomonas sp.]